MANYNYIRACFCVDHSLQAAEFSHLLRALEQLECRYNFWTMGRVSGYLALRQQELSVEEEVLDRESNPDKIQQLASWLASPGYLSIELGWLINSQKYSARLMQNWYDPNAPRKLFFDVEQTLFLPGSQIEFLPQGEIEFERLRQAVGCCVKYIDPAVGKIDYEVDPDCGSSQEFILHARWGNYYSERILAQWNPNTLEALEEIVNEYYEFDKRGILTFIHPLTANQAWTSRHEKVNKLLHNNLPRTT
jgi:hypothetical protein